MNSITTCVGVDVSKDRPDVQIPGEPLTWAGQAFLWHWQRQSALAAICQCKYRLEG